MKKTYTFDYMLNNCGCYPSGKTADLFFKDSKADISIDTILSSAIPLKDKFWFIVRKTELTVMQKRQIAIDVAEIVLPIYENRYPNNTSVREAIESAKLFIGGNISINALLERRRAAYAAVDAVDAAYAAAVDAAYAAVDAAYAAVAAAVDAAAVDAAVAAAVDAAVDAADRNYFTTSLTDYLNKTCNSF